MFKAVTDKQANYIFIDHTEKYLPFDIDAATDLPKISNILKKCFGQNTLPKITITNKDDSLQNRNIIDILVDHIYKNTDNSTEDTIYLLSLSTNSAKTMARNLFINKLAHESTHVICQKLFPQRPDTYLATMLGAWVCYDFGYTQAPWLSKTTRYLGLGEQSFLKKTLDPRLVYLIKKIQSAKTTNAAYIEAKYGYDLGTAIYEIVRAAAEKKRPTEEIYTFIQKICSTDNLLQTINDFL